MDTITGVRVHQLSVSAIINTTTELILEVNREVDALPFEGSTETTIYIRQYVTNHIVVSLAVGLGRLITSNDRMVVGVIDYVTVFVCLINILPVGCFTCLLVWTSIALSVVSVA